MNVTGLAISTLLAIAVSVWMFVVGRDPRTWRLRWLDLFGMADGDTPRQTRLLQEHQLRFMAFVLFFMMVAMSVSCLFWTVFQLREQLRPKSAVEQELQQLRERVEQVVRTR
jgi:Na+/melibiose symporter-like transporter